LTTLVIRHPILEMVFVKICEKLNFGLKVCKKNGRGSTVNRTLDGSTYPG
jgi:hypothetical protein